MSQQEDPLETFRDEARDLLAQLEASLIHLEESPDDLAEVDNAFRALHTIKGSGNMFELSELVRFTHTVENAFDRVRNGELAVSRELVSAALKAKDHIATLVEREELDEDESAAGRELLSTFAELAGGAQPAGSASAGAGGTGDGSRGRADDDGGRGEAGAQTGMRLVEDAAEESEERTFRIRFRPERRIFSVGANPLLLFQELEELGQLIVMGFSDDVPPLEELEPEQSYLSWDMLLTTRKDEQAIRDVFMFVEDLAELNIEVIDEGDLESSDISYKRLGEILVERGDLSRDELRQVMESKGYLGQALVSRGYVSSERVDSALEEQQYVRSKRAERQESTASSTIKVGTEKLDSLVNLVGEFVSMHANLTLQASRKEDQDMQSLAEQMEGLVRQLRDLSIDMHMVPVNALFSGFRRMVRDLAAELGKEVSLELKGTDTELDKNVIEALKDPLLHIIRNSIDHGIESAEERREAGKPEKGTVTLSAYYSGAHVAIDVLDDGKGLDAERIRAKAAERGVIGAEDSLSDSEALQLIFAPGFSTSETATSVSGRGVGMDVVKQNIEKLGGTVGLESERGSGTRISIRIPLTLAIVEGLLADIGGGYYMINLSYIVECLDYRNLDQDTTQNLVDFRGELVPFVDLNHFFGLDGDGSAGELQTTAAATEATMAGPGGMDAGAATIDRQLVVVAFEGYKIGLLVDRIYDKYQTVIKSLGKVYERVDGISGAVILGDGTPALMLDVDRLVRLTATDLDHRQGSNGNGRTRS